MARWPNNEAYRKLARELTRRRRALGISQWDLDQTLGISFGYVAKLELGMRIATGPLLLDWAKALGVPLAPATPAPRRTAASSDVFAPETIRAPSS